MELKKAKGKQSNGTETKNNNLIIGGSGQDGLYLALKLVRRGEAVTLTWLKHDPTAKLLYLGILNNVKLVKLDITNCISFRTFLTTIEVNTVYFFAAQSSVSQSFKNEELTFAINYFSIKTYTEILADLNIQAKTIFCASSECFGNHGENLINSETEFRPLSPYARSKVEMVDFVRSQRSKFGYDFRIAFLFNHESEFRTTDYLFGKIASYIYSALNNERDAETLKLGNLDLKRDYSLCDEIVHGIWLLAKSTESMDCVIASGKSISLYSAAKMMLSSNDLDFEKHVLVDQNKSRVSDVPAYYADVNETLRKFNWKPETLGKDVFLELSKRFQTYYHFNRQKIIRL